MTEQRRVPDSTQKGGSGATPLDPPSNCPHISGKIISLLLSNYDRIIVLVEIQQLEAVSLVAHMEGSRPNRLELRRMLYASFPKEISTIVDIQFGVYKTFTSWSFVEDQTYIVEGKLDIILKVNS